MLQMFSYNTFCYRFCCKCNTFLEKQEYDENFLQNF